MLILCLPSDIETKISENRTAELNLKKSEKVSL